MFKLRFDWYINESSSDIKRANTESRFRSFYSASLASRVLNRFRTYLVTKFERRLASELFYAIPGENCAVWGCGSCRRTKGLGILGHSIFYPPPPPPPHRGTGISEGEGGL